MCAAILFLLGGAPAIFAQSASLPSILESTNLVFSQPEVLDPQSPHVAAEGWISFGWKFDVDDENFSLKDIPLADRPVFELQQSTTADFTEPLVIYQGIDTSSAVSGLSEGTYFYRVRGSSADGAETGEWSLPVPVVVKYTAHDRFLGVQLLWWMMGLGGVVFVATVGFLVVRTIHQDVDDLPEE